MIHILDKSKCCGCNACVQRCPKQCITMNEDEEGFLYPTVKHSICINCGLCEKICPVINHNEPKQPFQVFAAKNRNESQRLQSSSGGIFILLAEHIIEQGGVVFGARFNKNWEVEHGYAETLEELTPLMRSKYVQSRINNTYKEAEQFLKQGRQVMFVGTPCQIAGLKKFLQKEYENLLAVDLICHGVPSPGVWRKYLEEIKYGQNKDTEKNTILSSTQKSISIITDINFREKQLGGYTWEKFGFVIHTKSLLNDENKTIGQSCIFKQNLYCKAFLTNLILRPSCYACTAKNGASNSDLTIADFWGIQNIYPGFYDNKGISLICICSHKGSHIIEVLSPKLEKKESSITILTTYNPMYWRSVSIPSKRQLFWNTFTTNHSVTNSVEIATYISTIDRFIQRIHNYTFAIKQIIKTKIIIPKFKNRKQN